VTSVATVRDSFRSSALFGITASGAWWGTRRTFCRGQAQRKNRNSSQERHGVAKIYCIFFFCYYVDEDSLCTMILAAAFRVHSRLGPGLSESVYQQVLAYELTKGGLSVEVQKSIPIFYDELFFDDGYRADLIVEKEGSTRTEIG